MKTLIIVDAQVDFISGSLACKGSDEALKHLVELIESNPDMAVIYTADWHSPTNGSFEKNGGIWPVHCVENTEGAGLYQGFYSLSREDARPNDKNTFKKGRRDDVEEYSGCLGTNADGDVLKEYVTGDILVAGFASEYCVRETLLGLREEGLNAALYLPGVAYVDEKDHEKNIADLKDKGIEIVQG
ncbi:isochorismatase family protein [Aedoeadaptatus coli]|uniref:isochorismatase family protein n=1 Tax=Aedoeadaptatus coli TaxID=2058292 RepID=UPI000D54C8C6|nr:isochorismatase family protein [Peptoniphilus coli]